MRIEWTLPGRAASIALFLMAVAVSLVQAPAAHAAAGNTALKIYEVAKFCSLTFHNYGPTLVTMLLIYGAGLHYLVLGLPGLGYNKHIELIPVGWRDLSRRIAETTAAIRKETGGDPLIVGMDRYAIASELAFYGAERTKSAVETSSAHLFGGIGLMYERWTPAELQEGRNLLLVAWDPGDLTGKIIESHAERLGPVEDDVLREDGAT